MWKSSNRLDLGLASLIVFVTVFLMAGVYFRLLRLHVLFEEFYYHHWLSIIGTTFIALFAPLYPLLKRRYLKKFKMLQRVHIFGNLLAVMLVSIHFTQEVTRPLQSRPDLGTGIVLYATMLLLVATGFLRRFQIAKSLERYWKFIHVSVTLTFYLVIIAHVLHGLGII